MRFAPILVATLLLVGCSTTKQALRSVIAIMDEPAVVLPKEAPEKFQNATKLLHEQKYQEAFDSYQNYLSEEPASPWTQSAILNSGRALEGLERWSEAADRYHAVISATDNAPKLRAFALYRMSFIHEARGEDQQTVATLHDLLSRRNDLPRETATAELPARLAAAYARVGNFNLASEYYRNAEMGIAVLKKDQRDLPAWLPRTLYYMGQMPSHRISWEIFESYLRPLSRAQSYLLQAAEIGMAPWSDLAAKDLIGTYTELWTAIEKAPAPTSSDPLIGAREVQELQWRRATLIAENLQELRSRALPGESSEQAKRIFLFAMEMEKKIGALFEQRPYGEGLTLEAAERKRALRGRVVAPSSTLEQRFIEDAKRARALPGTEALPEKSRPEQREDPNL